MSQPPSELPPPPAGQPAGEVPPPPSQPAAQPAAPPTQIAGQQTAPSTAVPHVPGLVSQSSNTNTMAVVSLVAAIASIPGHLLPIVGPVSLSVIAIITGFIARGQIKRTGEQGTGFAIAGIVIGLIHLALLVVVLIFILVVVFALGLTIFGYSRTAH